MPRLRGSSATAGTCVDGSRPEKTPPSSYGRYAVTELEKTVVRLSPRRENMKKEAS